MNTIGPIQVVPILELVCTSPASGRVRAKIQRKAPVSVTITNEKRTKLEIGGTVFEFTTSRHAPIASNLWMKFFPMVQGMRGFLELDQALAKERDLWQKAEY